jgi:exosortase
MTPKGSRRLLLLALALVVAVYAPTFAWLWERWTLSVWHNAHGLLIPPVVAYLVWLELRTTRKLPVGSSAWGFAFLLPAVALHVIDTGMHTEVLSAASIVLMLPGLSLLFLGVPRTKAIAFPLAFTAFALPIPLGATERIHLALRYIATDATASIVPMLGIPIFAEETTLHLANTRLTVADACSGFSTLYASAAMACLVAYQAEGWKRRLLVLASAAPLAVAANVVRVVILVAVVARTGIDVLETWIHPATGMLTFVLALPVIFWLGSAGRSQRRTAGGPAQPEQSRPPALAPPTVPIP